MHPMVVLTVIAAASASTCAKLYPDTAGPIALAFVLNATSFACLRVALQSSDMAQVQVMVSSGMILCTALIGLVLFADEWTVSRVLSTTFALLAIFAGLLTPPPPPPLPDEIRPAPLP